MPLVPGISTAPVLIEKTLRAIAAAGVPLAGSNVARLDDGVREHFFAFLEREYPQLLEGYQRLYAKPYAPKAYAAEVAGIVKSAARRLGLKRGDH